MPRPAWIGIRVYADDGYLGEVESALPTGGLEPLRALIVRTRARLWKTRFPAIPVSRVVACTPREHVARVAGTRRELSSMSECDSIAEDESGRVKKCSQPAHPPHTSRS